MSPPVFIQKGEEDKSLEFPEDLSGYKIEEHFKGGSGGVYRISDGIHNFILKIGLSENQLKHEILADTIYFREGVKVPPFAIYKGIPEGLCASLGLTADSSNQTLFRLSKVIEGHFPNDIPSIREDVSQHFVLDALLRNHDIASLDDGDQIKKLVVTADAQVYRINNGRFLSIEVKGEEDESDMPHVIELETLRHPKYSPLGAQLYAALTPEDIEKQKHRLALHAHDMIQTAIDLNDILDIRDFPKIHMLLIQRFRSLFEDVLYDSADEARPDRFERRRAWVNRAPEDNTAAGILSICIVKGKRYILVGNRIDYGRTTNLWCSLGGKAEPGIDKTLADTAIREVEEESYELTDGYLPFKYCQSFDLSLPGRTDLYRMFIPKQAHPFVPASRFNRRLEHASGHHAEYEEMIWISANSFFENLKLQSDDEDALLTVMVLNDGEEIERKIKIYPPMKTLLVEPEVEAAVMNVGVMLTISPDVTGEETPKTLPLAHLLPQSSKRTKADLAKHYYERTKTLNTIKRAGEGGIPLRAPVPLPPDELPPPPLVEVLEAATPDFPVCLSEKHLNIVLGEESKGLDLNQKLELFFRTKALGKETDYSDDFKKTMVKAVLCEREYQANGYLTLYHAAPAHVVLLYDLVSQLNQMIQHEPRETFRHFRAHGLGFKAMPTLQAFLSHFDALAQTTERVVYNYLPGYQELGLSCNVFLLGNHSRPNSASYALLQEGRAARSIKIFEDEGVLHQGLITLGLSVPLIKLVLAELRAYYTAGLDTADKERRPAPFAPSLYQIHVPKEKLDRLAYGAVAGGERYYFDDDESLQTFLETMQTGEFKSYQVNDLQARLFLHPDGLREAHTEVYQAHTSTLIDKRQHDAFLEREVRLIFETILVKGLRANVTLEENKDLSLNVFRHRYALLTGDKHGDNPQAQLNRLCTLGSEHQAGFFLKQHPNFNVDVLDDQFPIFQFSCLFINIDKDFFIRTLQAYIDTQKVEKLCIDMLKVHKIPLDTPGAYYKTTLLFILLRSDIPILSILQKFPITTCKRVILDRETPLLFMATNALPKIRDNLQLQQDLLEFMISQMSAEELQAMMPIDTTNKFRQCLIKNKAIMEILLTKMPAPTLIEMMCDNEKTKGFNTASVAAIHHLKYAPDTVSVLLSALPEEARLPFLTRNISDTQSLLSSWVELAKTQRAPARMGGFSVFGRTKHSKAPPPGVKPLTIKGPDTEGAPGELPELTFNRSALLRTVFTYLPPAQIQEVILSKKGLNANNLLQRAGLDPDLAEVILRQLPEDERLPYLMSDNRQGVCYLNSLLLTRNAGKTITTVLEALPNTDKVHLVRQILNPLDATLKAPICPNTLAIIMQALPDKSLWLDLLKTPTHPQSQGRTYFTTLLQNKAFTRTLIKTVGKDEIVRLAKTLNTEGKTIIPFFENQPALLLPILDLDSKHLLRFFFLTKPDGVEILNKMISFAYKKLHRSQYRGLSLGAQNIAMQDEHQRQEDLKLQLREFLSFVFTHLPHTEQLSVLKHLNDLETLLINEPNLFNDITQTLPKEDKKSLIDHLPNQKTLLMTFLQSNNLSSFNAILRNLDNATLLTLLPKDNKDLHYMIVSYAKALNRGDTQLDSHFYLLNETCSTIDGPMKETLKQRFFSNLNVLEDDTHLPKKEARTEEKPRGKEAPF